MYIINYILVKLILKIDNNYKIMKSDFNKKYKYDRKLYFQYIYVLY